MPIDFSIGRWLGAVATTQWPQEARKLDAIGSAVPEPMLDSRALAEVHRLDLALFVVFEEVALRVSGSLTRLAPDLDALNFSAQQTLDEARHHEVFHDRLVQAAALCGTDAAGAQDAILIPPLRRFIERCYEVADGGRFLDAMVLVNLVLEGMAYPLYAYEERYWKPVDPYLARLIRGAYADETRHVNFGARLVDAHLKGNPEGRARTAALCADARQAMNEVFTYYVRKFVGLFDAVAKRHAQLFAGAEFEPGRLIADTPYEEQVAVIRRSIEREHGRLLGRAGLA